MRSSRKARWAAAVIAVAAVGGGLTAATSGAALASATGTATAPSAVSAAPCGLSYSGPVGGRYDYTIRNCHNYAVERKLDLRRPIVGYPDGKCHRIPANSSIRDWVSLPDSVSIAGMKPC
ncbi:hypothetical protein FHS43_002026 [Streptosporangium becharense]|uniref:Secreted protein n=1 Tax=Streptosporangium becharense TaxID=1816182 RepID=A0A7W9IB61_9ACTN|nr:hypothetical protein [Streptosporangium becharense]MBB2910763.1 hypothetical protein [Streptosporangium becharense]MBB5817458.1 hypothetical protein [Streptosporangium becharense]